MSGFGGAVQRTVDVMRKPLLLIGLFALVASGPALAQPALPDLSVYTSNIFFVSKDGVGSSFAEAEIGDAVNIAMSISNGAGAGTANNVTGYVRPYKALPCTVGRIGSSMPHF